MQLDFVGLSESSTSNREREARRILAPAGRKRPAETWHPLCELFGELKALQRTRSYFMAFARAAFLLLHVNKWLRYDVQHLFRNSRNASCGRRPRIGWTRRYGAKVEAA